VTSKIRVILYIVIVTHITNNHHKLCTIGDIETSKKMQDEMIQAAEEFYQSLG
jgi:hypothetical protein